MMTATEEKEEIKMRRRKICPILSLNSPQGATPCLEKDCEWYDSVDEVCAIYHLKWITNALNNLLSVMDKEDRDW